MIGVMRRVLAFLSLFAAPALGCAAPQQISGGSLPPKPPGRYEESLKIDGTERKFVLRVPKAYDATKPLPLVVVLHGWTRTAAWSEMGSGMAEGAEKNGYIAVFPQGLGGQFAGWNAGFIDLSGYKADDVKFIDSLITKVQGEVGVDSARIFVCGHSNGAFMAHTLAARLSGRIAAIGAVAGTIGVRADGGQRQIPDPASPVSILIIHGKRDATVAYDDSTKGLLAGVSAPKSALWWAEKDGCDLTPTKTSPRSNVVIETYGHGKAGTEVSLVTIANGLHEWPGGIYQGDHESASGISAAEFLFGFFNTHPKLGS